MYSGFVFILSNKIININMNTNQNTSSNPPAPSDPSITDYFCGLFKWFSKNCGLCCTCCGKI